MTRDSGWLKLGMIIGGVIGVLAVFPDTVIITYGIPLSFLPYLRLANLVFTTACAYLNLSPLKISAAGRQAYADAEVKP